MPEMELIFKYIKELELKKKVLFMNKNERERNLMKMMLHNACTAVAALA